jgi:hypothetical protein
MAAPLTAEDILPLVERLTPQERVRLLRLLSVQSRGDGAVYGASPPHPNEFDADDDVLAWDSEGWDGIK